MAASLLAVVYRILLANILTAFYSTVVHMTYSLRDMKNPPNTTVPAALTLPSQCIDPKYGEHKYLEVNNLCLHCVDSGNKSLPLLLLVHGFPEYWYSWRYQILYFNTKYRVVACDSRGSGDSDKPLSVAAYKINYLVDDIKGVIEKLGYKKAILLCHDWGGIICSRVRETYPSYVTALISLSSTSIDAWFHEIWNNAYQTTSSGYFFLYRHCDLAEKTLKSDNMSLIEQLLIIPGKTSVTKDDLQCYKYFFSQPGGLKGINLYRANFRYDYSAKVYSENIPYTCAHGSEEYALSPGILNYMNMTFKNFTPAIIKGVSHFMPQQDPDTVNSYVKNFLVDQGLY